MRSIAVGKRVVMPACPVDGLGEEHGVIRSFDRRSECYIVQVDVAIDENDDKIREVYKDDVTEELPVGKTWKSN